jgi:Domain of unknown function (DUF4365)
VTSQLGLVFGEQSTSDFGVDAQAEMKREGRPTGRLVSLQIKTGSAYLSEPCEDGWIFRPKKKHVKYWLNHSLPVYVLLVNLDAMTVYWQEITEQQLRTGPRGGAYIQVPRANVLATAGGPWEVLRPLVYRDLFGVGEEQARQLLLEAVAGPRRPGCKPVFPGHGTAGGVSRLGGSGPRLPGTRAVPPRDATEVRRR